MLIKEKILLDLKTALKNADAFRLGVLRLLSSSLQNEAIAKKSQGKEGELTEEEVIAVLKREAKKRRESVEIYLKAGRPELAENEEREQKIIKEYLPEEISREDIEAVVRKIIDSGILEHSLVIKASMAELKGNADGRLVLEVIKSILK